MNSLPALTIGVLVASTTADYVFQSATVGNGCDAPGLLVQAHNGVCGIGDSSGWLQWPS